MPENMTKYMNNTKEEIDDSFLTLNECAKPAIIREDTMMNWHQRLGHLNAYDICVLAKDPQLEIKIKGVKKLGFCKICKKVKQTQRPFQSATQATRLGYQVFIDLAGGGRHPSRPRGRRDSYIWWRQIHPHSNRQCDLIPMGIPTEQQVGRRASH